MPWRCFVLALAVGLLCSSSAAWAILIETGGVRVSGYFVRDDGKKLTIRVRTAGGQEKEMVYERAKVKIVHQIDWDLLQKLSKANPKGYRNYAEELAGQPADEEAKDLAMRLFLTAAYLDPQQLGQSCLLRMSALARTPAEARKCRAMAFLLGPKGDANLLKTDAVKPSPLTKAQASALTNFLKALHYYRAGLMTSAAKVAKSEGVDKIFSMAPGMMDQQAFLQMCKDANCATCKSKGKVACAKCNGSGTTFNMFGRLDRCPTCNGQRGVDCSACEGTGFKQDWSDEVMRSTLRAELWAVDQLLGADAAAKKEPADTNWSSILQSRQVSPVAPLSLETLTEFDPRKCLYREGKWVAP